MDITKTVVTLRDTALLYGDYGTYHTQLSRKLLNCRKKLNIATKNRGKFQKKAAPTAEQIAENHEYLRLQLLTVERNWANAMAMKATHSADTKGMNGKARSHIVSKLDKGSRIAEDLADALAQTAVSGASPTDVLEARAYAALLKGAALFEKQSWKPCLISYAEARVIYIALSTSVKGDIFKDLLSETIDPSIRYAAYQAKIPRTEPVPSIARKAFLHSDDELVAQIKDQYPDVLESGEGGAKKNSTPGDNAPTSLTWRGREVKIEDAAIAVAWGAVAAAKAVLAEKTSSSADLSPKELAASYDDILIASQDAVDATKQAIDELKGEGVTQSDPRMQSLQITRTAVNYEMISWRIGRNRVLIGKDDGIHLDFSESSNKKRKSDAEAVSNQGDDLPPGRQIAKLKEKVVLYDGTLQSIESIQELPGVANDQELSSRLEATKQYFTALKCLSLARSHSIASSPLNALALTSHALSLASSALPALSSSNTPSSSTPRNIDVTASDVQSLHNLLTGELQRSRALVAILNNTTRKETKSSGVSKPLAAQLSSYPTGGVDLENIVTYPPQLEPIPVKPLFLDVAWNYIEYPSKGQQAAGQVTERAPEAGASAEDAKPQKRGWFGFGR